MSGYTSRIMAGSPLLQAGLLALAVGGGACKSKESVAPTPITAEEEALVRESCREFLGTANPYRSSTINNSTKDQYVFETGRAAEDGLKFKLGKRYGDIANKPLEFTIVEARKEFKQSEAMDLVTLALMSMAVWLGTSTLCKSFGGGAINKKKAGATLAAFGLGGYLIYLRSEYEGEKVSYPPVPLEICEGPITVRGSGE